MAWLSDKWRKLNEVALVEKDDALYLRLGWGAWGGRDLVGQCCTVLLLVLALKAFLLLSWVEVLLGVALVASVILAMLLWYQIERRRFPFGRLLVRMDQDALTLALPGYVWPWQIRVQLSTLRGIMIETPFASIIRARNYTIRITFSDGQEKTVRPIYSYRSHVAVRVAVTDFLQRKLPPSVKITVDNEPPLFGRGVL